MSHGRTVFIVDDDSAFSESLSLLIDSMGYNTVCYASADEFLASYDPETPGCILLDVRMPGMSGLELQLKLAELEHCSPTIVITGFAEVPIAILAFRQGAVEFLQKTFSEQELLSALERALARDEQQRASRGKAAELGARFAQLSAAENAVLDLILQGRSNKVIAMQLNIVVRTVEDRRARIMRKVGAETVPELVRMAMNAGRIKLVRSK